MRYITAEQFKEQPKEVQQVFLDWYKPQVGDLSCSKKSEIAVMNSSTMLLLKDKGIMKTLKERNIPLFTLQQLWEFIEDKARCFVTVDFIAGEYWVKKSSLDKDKLQAFWKCACEVAKIIK